MVRGKTGGGSLWQGALGVAVLALVSSCTTFPRLFEAGGDGKVVHTANATCVYLAPEISERPLSSCERPLVYEIRAGSETYAWKKNEFQREFHDQLLAFLRTTAYPWHSLNHAIVEIWLTAPVFAPEAAAFVAVVLGPGGNFAVQMPLAPAAWRLGEGSDVTWLGRASYPSMRARRVDAVVVAPLPMVTPARLRSYLAASGALTEVTPGGLPAVREVRGDGTLFQLATEPFAERAVADRLRHGPAASSVLASVRYIPAGATEGYKARVFTFALLSP